VGLKSNNVLIRSKPHVDARFYSREGNALQRLIVMQAKALQDAVQKLINLMLLPNTKTAAMSVQELVRAYIDKACALATELGVLEAPGGNSDGSLPIRGQVRKSRPAPTPVPVSKVFARLNPSIQAPPQVQETEDNSITAVEQAPRRVALLPGSFQKNHIYLTV
jgi:hypothetical protein